jgi:hypothetical protein
VPVAPAPAVPVAPAPAVPVAPAPLAEDPEEVARRINENIAARRARLAQTTIGGPLPIGTATGLPTNPALTEQREALVGPVPSSTAGTVTAAGVPVVVPAPPPAAPVRVPVRGVVHHKTGRELPAFATVVPRVPAGPPPVPRPGEASGAFTVRNPMLKEPADVVEQRKRFAKLPQRLSKLEFNRLPDEDKIFYVLPAAWSGTFEYEKRAPPGLFPLSRRKGGLRKKTFKSRRGKKTNGRGTRRRKDRANRSHKNARRRT